MEIENTLELALLATKQRRVFEVCAISAIYEIGWLEKLKF